MKKFGFLFGSLALFALLTALLLFPVVALHASESAGGEAAKADKADKGKEGGEGEKKDDKKDKKDKTVTGGLFDGDPVYVHMKPFYLPVVTDRGAEQIVTLLVDLKVATMAKADKIQDSMPRVRDAMMQVLYGGLSNGSLRIGPQLNFMKVKAKIAMALEKVMGPDAVDEVLIQAIGQRKM